MTRRCRLQYASRATPRYRTSPGGTGRAKYYCLRRLLEARGFECWRKSLGEYCSLRIPSCRKCCRDKCCTSYRCDRHQSRAENQSAHVALLRCLGDHWTDSLQHRFVCGSKRLRARGRDATRFTLAGFLMWDRRRAPAPASARAVRCGSGWRFIVPSQRFVL
jgi:hypothetical protein